MEFCRGVPEVIFAILFVWAVGVGPLAGLLAIAIHSAGALGKLFSEVNENIDPKPLEGIRAAGGSWFDEIRSGLVPQVMPNFPSSTLLPLAINIRPSSNTGLPEPGGVGPLAGLLAIAIHSAGARGKLFSEVNENIDHKPLEGIRAAGGSWFDEIRYGVVPQVLPNFTSYTLLRFEINIRASSIIGFVGAGGVGQELYYVINFNFYEEVSALVLLVVAVVTCIDLLSARIRHRFIGREQMA